MLQTEHDIKDSSLMIHEEDQTSKPEDEEADSISVKWYKIDNEMITSKFTYFFENAKRSCITPYMMLFLTSVGLDHTRAGLVNGIRYVGYVIGLPLWGIIADRTKAHRLIVSVICILAMVFSCSQPLVTLVLGNDEVNQCPVSSNSQNMSLTNTTQESINNGAGFNTNPLFYTLMILSLLTNLFDGSTLAFADAGVMQKIRASKQTHDFGRQRLYGAFGFACGVFLSSGIIEIFPKINITCYSGAFFVYFFMITAFVISSNKLYKGLSFEHSDEREITQRVKSQLWKTLCKIDTVVFMTTALSIGIVRGINISFLFLYMKELNASNLIMGLALVTAAASSMSIHFFSSTIIKLVGGTYQAISVSFLAWAVRLFVIRYLTNAWQVILLQLCHGVCVALYVSTAARHVTLISPSPILSSMYGIMNSLYSGCGLIIANVIGGLIYDEYGSGMLFLITSIFSFTWAVILILYILAIPYLSNNPESKKLDILLTEIQK